jgi:hypothetical protein
MSRSSKAARRERERMHIARFDWERDDCKLEPTSYGDDVLKVTFDDGGVRLLLWRPCAGCWRMIDLAGYDPDRVPTRLIDNERKGGAA